ncbi:MAG: diacylglycerol kinase family protein [Bryobacteraceae bacterium]
MKPAAATRATIFINASSGFDTKEGAPQQIETLYKQSGMETDFQYVKAGVNLADLAREAVAKGSTIVVAGGGDGTLSATASALVSTETAFGVLPVGTLNHFARDLNIPLDLHQAAQVILGGHTTDVDVVEVNGKTFLSNSILGLYPIYRYIELQSWRKAGQKSWRSSVQQQRFFTAILCCSCVFTSREKRFDVVLPTS